MASSSFHREIRVSADRGRCWQSITDVHRLVSWVSILRDAHENEHLKSYDAVLEDRLGPFRLRADLAVTVSDVKAGERLHARAEGEDRQVNSRIIIEGDLRLEPADEGTLIVVDGRYEITGRVATLGSSMIHSKAQKVIDEFFENTSRELS